MEILSTPSTLRREGFQREIISQEIFSRPTELLSLETFEALGKPAGYTANWDGHVPGPRDAVRRLEPMDFLGDFTEWLWQRHSDNEDELMWLRRDLRRNCHKAYDVFDDGATTKENSLLRNWVEHALWVAVTLEEQAELEPLALLSREGEDRGGNLNFRHRLVRCWFERFLHETRKRKDWEACGFTYADLVAIQSPKKRRALQLKA